MRRTGMRLGQWWPSWVRTSLAHLRTELMRSIAEIGAFGERDAGSLLVSPADRLLEPSDLAAGWTSGRHLWTTNDTPNGCSHLHPRRSVSDVHEWVQDDGLWSHHLWIRSRVPLVSAHPLSHELDTDDETQDDRTGVSV